VYVEYASERDTVAAFQKFQGRWYGGRQLNVEFTCVSSWKSALCGESELKPSCHITGAFDNYLSLVDTAVLCERHTCTNIDYLSASLRLSVRVAHVRGVACVCLLTLLRLAFKFL
jgi:hypothetical protein